LWSEPFNTKDFHLSVAALFYAREPPMQPSLLTGIKKGDRYAIAFCVVEKMGFEPTTS
jgi:hypothetical protein